MTAEEIEETVERYMALPYRIELIPDPNDGGWVVAIPDLPGCLSQGDTVEEAMEMIRDAQRGWLAVSLENDATIPAPRDIDEYGRRLNVIVPRTLYRDVARAAETEGVKLNLFMVTALARAVERSLSSTIKEPPVAPEQTDVA